MLNRKKILYILIIFFSTYQLAYSQEIKVEEFSNFLKNNNSKLFVFLSGNYLTKINPKAELIDSIYFDVENKFDTYQLLYNKDYYLINSLGGQVYKSYNKKFKRIDNSFTHKNQILSSIFIYDNIIYRFGGYGYFDSKNFITYFSNETLEWEVLKTNSIIFPSGLFNNKFFIHKDALYVLGGYTIDKNNRETQIENKEYWKFSFLDKNWIKIGESSMFSGSKQNIFDFYDDGKFYFQNNGFLNMLDIEKNDITQYETIKLLDKTNFNYPAFKLNDTIYFIGNSPNSENSKRFIYKFPIKNLAINKVTNIKMNSSNFFTAIFLIVLLMFLYSKRNIFERKLKILNSKINYGLKNITLNDLEIKFFEKLIDFKKVNNNELLNFVNSNIDISQKTRIKNKTIISLNIKLEILSNGKFIIKKNPSDHDKRYYSYQLRKNM